MGWCSLRTSEWDILSFMRYSCPAFTYASFTHVVSGKLPAQPWYLCSCSRWVLLPCAAGGTQTVNTLLPNWRIAGLNDSPAVTLSLLCLLCHTTRYLLGSLSVSVMGFDSVWVQCFFFPPSDVSEELCLTAHCAGCTASCHVNADFCSSVWWCSQAAQCCI